MLAPINQLAMLTDYVDPAERSVACLNQDVVYGMGVVALDRSPVVVQVPDFGKGKVYTLDGFQGEFAGNYRNSHDP